MRIDVVCIAAFCWLARSHVASAVDGLPWLAKAFAQNTSRHVFHQCLVNFSSRFTCDGSNNSYFNFNFLSSAVEKHGKTAVDPFANLYLLIMTCIRLQIYPSYWSDGTSFEQKRQESTNGAQNDM